MAISKFLNCFLCGSSSTSDEKDAHAIVPVTYSIEGKKVSQRPTDSADSLTSSSSSIKPNFSKDEKEKVVLPSSPASLSSNAALIAPLAPEPLKTRKNRALVVASKGTYDILDDEFPVLNHEKEVVIRNLATGLNPIDYKSVDYNFCLPSFPWVTGREMAGVVEVVGSEVEGLKVGDLVWTSTYYRDRRAGCFQDFVTVPAHTVLPLPSNLTPAHAACLGVAGLTAAMTLWRWLGVPMPSTLSSTPSAPTSPKYLLIWGGSTSTGQFAIQIASRCSIPVIAVTSAKTAPLVRSLGATVVIRDGKSNEEIVAEIRSIAADDVTRAIDLVGTKTAAFCLQALSASKKSVFAPLAMIGKGQEVPATVDVVTVEMKAFVLDEASRVYAEELNALVERGNLRLPEVVVLEGGVDAVVEGLERLKGGDMGGRKMVVRW